MPWPINSLPIKALVYSSSTIGCDLRLFSNQPRPEVYLGIYFLSGTAAASLLSDINLAHSRNKSRGAENSLVRNNIFVYICKYCTNMNLYKKNLQGLQTR